MLQDWPHMVREAGENMGIFLTKLSNETRIILEHSGARHQSLVLHLRHNCEIKIAFVFILDRWEYNYYPCWHFTMVIQTNNWS